MKQVCPWLPTALVFAAACGGQTSLDTFEDGVPSYLLEADLGGGSRDAGSDDASSEGGDSSRDGSAQADASQDGSAQDGSSEGGSSGAGAVGDPCSGDDDCEGSTASCLENVSFGGFLEIEFVGGYCVVGGCSDDADCPEGTACLDANGMRGCNKLCDSGSDCREAEGYQCDTIPLSSDSRTFCLPELNLGGL